MNHELKQQANESEAEIDTEEIDAQIEALKESHPRITKEEYWTALKQAKIAYVKLKEIIAPMQAKEIGDYDATDQEMLEERRVARFQLALKILDCRDILYPTAKRIVEAMDDSTYFFLPEDRPGYGEANPIFGAEKLGIPELLPATLVLSGKSWSKAFPESFHFNEDIDKFCANDAGFNFKNKFFNEEAVYSSLGLAVISGEHKNSDIIDYARHESVHTADFFRNNRVGADQMLSELVAYRIDSKLTGSRDKKLGRNPLENFYEGNFASYVADWKVNEKFARLQLEDLRTMINNVENKLSFVIVTELLLNSETITEFLAAAQMEIEKAKK